MAVHDRNETLPRLWFSVLGWILDQGAQDSMAFDNRGIFLYFQELVINSRNYPWKVLTAIRARMPGNSWRIHGHERDWFGRNPADLIIVVAD